MEKTKVTIIIRGGNIQGIYSDHEALDITVLDYDNMAVGDSPVQEFPIEPMSNLEKEDKEIIESNVQ